MDAKDFLDKINQSLNNLPRAVRSDLSDAAGKLAVDHFTENFQLQGFVDNGLNPWDEVQRRKESNKRRGKSGKLLKRQPASTSRPILTGSTGDLGRSIEHIPGNSQVEVFSDIPYAAAHNEGTTTAGRNHSVTIPKRQFIGPSAELDAKIEKEIAATIKKFMP
ncbi:MAG: phage virion morphogenesis protein [Bacteroidales bacterium]|nr:phage virion morphogenesis protein [Bacteroidales bacterium]